MLRACVFHLIACSPYIIGTMVQSALSSVVSPSSGPSTTTAATTSNNLLQMHHNFRWIMCANHSEPVAGFLGRYLQRRLVAEETRGYSPGGTTAGRTTPVGTFGRRFVYSFVPVRPVGTGPSFEERRGRRRNCIAIH